MYWFWGLNINPCMMSLVSHQHKSGIVAQNAQDKNEKLAIPTAIDNGLVFFCHLPDSRPGHSPVTRQSENSGAD